MAGFWAPHSSSVDFCEPNYLLSAYIAEPHNAFSSLFITGIAIFGILFGNPTGEMRWLATYGVLATIGIGSFALHATLGGFTQSLDEVPMLWLNITYIYSLVEMTTPKSKNRIANLSWYLLAVALIQTTIYYLMRSLYWFFLTTFTLTVALVILWTGRLVFHKEQRDAAVVRVLFCRFIASFTCVGLGVWLVDMINCETILPYYLASPFGGLTLHAIWHIAAAMGSYLLTTTLVVCRIRALGRVPVVNWVSGCIPVATASDDKMS